MSGKESALARTATDLLRDLDDVDALAPAESADQQKLALIVEAMEQTVRIAEHSVPIEFVNPVPASLADHGP